VTMFVTVLGSSLQFASSLRPQHKLCGMRHMRFAEKPGNNFRQKIPSSKIDSDSVTSFTNSFTRLFDSPVDSNNLERDTATIICADDEMNNSSSSKMHLGDVSLQEPTISSSTSATYDCSSSLPDNSSNVLYNPSNSTKITAVVSNNDTKNPMQEMYFQVPSTVLENEPNSIQNEGQKSLDLAPKQLVRFFQDESPPVPVLLLNFVAIIWGSQHAIIKTVVEDSDPAAFTFLRFTIASLIASPYLPGAKQTILNKLSLTPSDDDVMKTNEVDLWKPWRWGIEMGLWMFLGFSLQAIGLQTTTAQRSGFLLYLNVKFVPFFAKVLLDRQISTWTWVSAFAAFTGTALLALDGQSLGLNIGDIWSVMAAAASAMFILRLEKASFEVPESSELNATSLFVVALLSGIWLIMGNGVQQIAAEVMETAFAHPLELLYLGGVSTALANFIQAKAQKDIPAERASIIYSLDPVYGAFFSYVILGETLGGPQGYIGAVIIFVAAASNSFLQFSNATDTNE